MTITFYPRGKIIQARLSKGSKAIRISTAIMIEPHHKFVGQKFVGNTAEVLELNAELSRHKFKLAELLGLYGLDFIKIKENYNERPPEIPSEDTTLLHDLLRKYVKMMATGEVLSSSKKMYSPSSINLYRYATDVAREFAFFYKPIDIAKYHIPYDWSSEQKQQLAEKFSLYFKKFEDFMIDRGNSIKSRSELMNMVGVMLNYWANKFFYTLPKIPRLQSHEKAIVVFPPEFVSKFLTDLKTYENLSPQFKTVWEVSATILITTLRIGDAMSLDWHNLIINPKQVYLKKKNEKTGVLSEMPLPQFLSDIYRENMARYNRVYTLKPTKELIYQHINSLFKMYEDTHESVSVSQVDVRGNEFIVSKPLWEWVHPHMLRKTAITTMIYNKVPERFIKFASGHSVGSNAFERYVGHVERYYKSEINDYYGKMFAN